MSILTPTAMRLSLLLAALAALAVPAAAQTCTTSWAAPVSGLFTDAANWTSGVPGSADTACIQVPGTYTVSFAESRLIERLELGGASGTQTLALTRALSLGSGHVTPNGRLEVYNDCITIGCDGLPSVRETLTVEGTITLDGQVNFFNASGTLDIAPGGQLLVDSSGPRTIGGSGILSTLRVRGRVVFDPNGNTASDVTIRTQLDVDGGTVDVRAGQVNVNSGGRLRNATFVVAAGADVRVSRGAANVGEGIFVVEGTLSGDPQGTLQFVNGALKAGVGGATLAVGGTGLLTYFPSSLNFELQSAGGAFLNTGLLRVQSNGLRIRQVVLENAGTLRLEGTTITLLEGAVVRNRAGATVDLTDGGSFGDGDRTGRLENAGLLTTRVVAFTTQRISRLNERLRSLPGSELRIGATTQLDLDLPASTTFPEGVRVTGHGTLFIGSTEFLIEGEVSPGTDAQPIGTLASRGRLYFSRLAGSPRLVIDVDAGGLSDRIAFSSTGGVGFPVRPFGALVVRVRPGTTPQVGDTWTILTGTGANRIQGTFSQVVAQDAPPGIAFVAEYDNTGTSSITLRAVAVAPGGPITVSTDAPVGGGIRAVFLTGPGAPGVASARLDCTECLDAAAFGSIPAVLTGEGTLKEARFDLTSPRVYGYYDLVVQRPGQPDVRVPITVRPFLSYVVMRPGTTRGIGVRPAGLRYNWSALRVSNVTNADAPGYTVAAVDRQDGEQVAFALASGSRPFTESDPEQGPTRASLAFSRIPAGGTATLSYGQRMDPSEVLFPEQTPTGPDDRRIPFGDERTVIGLSAQHASFDRMRALIAGALQSADDAALVAFLTSAEAASPGSVQQGIGLAIDRPLTYTEGVNSLFGRVLSEIGRTTPVPPGLAVSAAPAFDEALDAATGRYLVASFRALNVDIETAPASVQALLEAEVTALGAGAPRPLPGGEGGQGGVCTPPAAPPGPPPSPPTGFFSNNLLRQAQALATRQAIVINVEQLRAIQRAAQATHDACVTVTGNTEERAFGQPPAGACSFPPLPPGGPSGGGGGACGPPAAPADPNDKTANNQYRCEIGTVEVGGEPVTRCVRYFVPRANAVDPIVYSVEFENLPQATAPAEFVTITDVLDDRLDPSTLAVIATSADSTFSYTVSGQTVTLRFVGIDLPPNVNAPEGQGFVTFSVQPRPGLADGTEIRNDASIVFDFNPPIVTPEVIHEIRETADLAAVVLAPDAQQTGQPFEVEVFVAHLQGDPALGASATITLPAAPLSVTPDVGACTGTTALTCTFETLNAGDVVRVSISMPALALGEATIAATAATTVFDAFTPNDRDAVVFPVVPVAGEETPDGFPTELTLAAPRPNPARGATTLRWGLPAAAAVDVRVFDLLGREVARVVEGDVAAGWHETRLDASRLASGVYVVRLVSGNVVQTRRVVVVR